MSGGKIDYKGSKAKLIMMGTKKQITGWRGELFVAVIQYGEEDDLKYDVVPDSTDPADVDDLPEIKTFDNQAAAVGHFMKLENNKDQWKSAT